MASQDRVTALRKFYPPESALQPCTLRQAKVNTCKYVGFPPVGLLAARGLVWEVTGEQSDAGKPVPCGKWACVACADLDKPVSYAPRQDVTDYGFRRALDHWRRDHGQQVRISILFNLSVPSHIHMCSE